MVYQEYQEDFDTNPIRIEKKQKLTTTSIHMKSSPVNDINASRSREAKKQHRKAINPFQSYFYQPPTNRQYSDDDLTQK